MARPDHTTIRNRLLSALPADDLGRLREHLVPVDLPVRLVLHAPREPIASVYFPETGVASQVVLLADGAVVEVGVIGNEGLIGMPVILGVETSSTECFIQIPGRGLRISAAVLREEMDRSAGLRSVLLRYAMAFHDQVSQTAACNRRHVLEERLARWLLMSHDRCDGDDIPLTHEFLGIMLGVRRAGVTVAAGILQKAGMIHYTSGNITILDRSALEAASCECYGIVKEQFSRMIP